MADKKVQLHDSAGNNLFPRVLLDQIYPVGSIYISVNATNPSTYFGGTWVKIGTGRTLMGAASDSDLGQTVDSGLPNITGNFYSRATNYNQSQFIWTGGGAFSTERLTWGGDTVPQQGPGVNFYNYKFNASGSNAIYGRSSIVQPPAVYVNFWQRTA